MLATDDAREVAARSGGPILDGGGPIIARDPEPDIDAAAYRRRFAQDIGDGVITYLGALDISTGSRFIRTTGPAPLGPAILDTTGSDLDARLDGWLGPGRVRQLVNRVRPMGRQQLSDGEKTWVDDKIGEGPSRWFPDVAIEIGSALAALLRQSLDRVVPRYLSAAVARGVQHEEETSTCSTSPPPPAPEDIVASHPLDALTIAALLRTTTFDYQAYRQAYPYERGRIGKLRAVSVEWEAPQNGTYWARITAPPDPTMPREATVEEAALALYGSETRSEEIIVAAPPLFGMNNATLLLEHHQRTLLDRGADIHLYGDARQEALSGPLLDEFARRQGAAQPTTAATRMDVLRTLGESLVIVATIEKAGAAFGMGRGSPVSSLAPLRDRLLQRRSRLTDQSDEEALSWSGQVEAQQAVLSRVAFAMDRHAGRLTDLTRLVEDAGVKLGGFNLPPYVREAMIHVAMSFADVALLSDLPESAAAALAPIEDEATALPVTFLEGTLASIQRTLDDARRPKPDAPEHDSYDVPGMQDREAQLKGRLANLRALIKADPEAAAKELREVQKLVQELQVEAELVGNMDQIDAAWQAMADGTSDYWSSMGTLFRREDLKDVGRVYHGRWKKVFRDWKSGDPALQTQARKGLDELRADPALRKWFGDVQALVKDAQIEALVGKVLVLMAITVITMGVGDIILAGAAGWELSAGATAVVVGGAEAATFTLLSQIFLDSEHGLGHLAYEFATNWAMFGVLRRFQLFAEVAKLGKVANLGGSVLLLSATTYAKADLDKYIKEGRHLSGEEVKAIALQGMAMAVAMHAIAPITKPLFAELEGSAYAFTSRLRANNRTQATLRAQVESLRGSRDFGAAQDYVSQERAWLQDRLEILSEIEALAAKEAEAGAAPRGGGIAAKIRMSAEDLAALRSQMQGQLAQVSKAELPLLYLEPKGPGLFTCPREHIGAVIQGLGQVTRTTVDPLTAVTTYEVKLPDGTTIQVMEQIAPAADTASSARAWADKLAESNPNRMTQAEIDADLLDFTNRKKQVAELYEQAKLDPEKLPPGVTLERLKLAVEGDPETGQRVPLTYGADIKVATQRLAELQGELKTICDSEGITDVVIVQLGSGTTGWSNAPKKTGKPWSSKSDVDFAIFSDQALRQAMEAGVPVNPKNQTAGQYTTLKNTREGDVAGFHDTPFGKKLRALQRRWNQKIYGNPNVDGFDFKLNLSNKPFKSAVPVLQLETPVAIHAAVDPHATRAVLVDGSGTNRYLGVQVIKPTMAERLPLDAKARREFHVTLLTPQEFAALSPEVQAELAKGVEIGGSPRGRGLQRSVFGDTPVYQMEIEWPEAQAFRAKLGLDARKLHVTLSGGIGDAARRAAPDGVGGPPPEKTP